MDMPVILIPMQTDEGFKQGQQLLQEALQGYRVIFVYGMSGSAIIIPPLTNNNTKETQQ